MRLRAEKTDTSEMVIRRPLTTLFHNMYYLVELSLQEASRLQISIAVKTS